MTTLRLALAVVSGGVHAGFLIVESCGQGAAESLLTGDAEQRARSAGPVHDGRTFCSATCPARCDEVETGSAEGNGNVVHRERARRMPRHDAAAPGGHIALMDSITRRMLRGAPAVLFVFGDNLAGTGLGGQAQAMRGEPNAVGLPTKRRPARDPGAYFTDADLPEVQRAAAPAIARLRQHLATGGSVVWPSAGIGTGRAELPTRAPAIARFYAEVLTELTQLTERANPRG